MGRALTIFYVSGNLRLVTTYVEHVLDALGDPTRRAVFDRLRGDALSVGEIAEGMNVSRPAVSQHLKVLKEAGLVADRPEGTRRIYVVDAQGLKALRTWLDGLWDETLGAFREAAEQETRKTANRRKRRL
jgi:DNA-binding transcriptional ArsR family regulator